MNCRNVKLLDSSKVICERDNSGKFEVRTTELTCLMVACIMGQLKNVKQIVEIARQKLSPDQFTLFINIKVCRAMGGNNALLYVCNSSTLNDKIFKYLITEAGADLDVINDYEINCLLLATKKQQINILYLLLENGVDIRYKDKTGCNALHFAATGGHYDIIKTILVYLHR